MTPQLFYHIYKIWIWNKSQFWLPLLLDHFLPKHTHIPLRENPNLNTVSLVFFFYCYFEGPISLFYKKCRTLFTLGSCTLTLWHERLLTRVKNNYHLRLDRKFPRPTSWRKGSRRTGSNNCDIRKVVLCN